MPLELLAHLPEPGRNAFLIWLSVNFDFLPPKSVPAALRLLTLSVIRSPLNLELHLSQVGHRVKTMALP